MRPCGQCHVPVGQNCWKHKLALVIGSYIVKIMVFFFALYRHLEATNFSRKLHTHATISRHASGNEGRKVPRCSASKNGIKKHSRKGKAAQSPTDPAFLTWAFCSLSSVSQQHILRNSAVRPLKHRVILG